MNGSTKLTINGNQDFDKNSLPSMSGASKRLHEPRQKNDVVKKQKVEKLTENIPKLEKKAYRPIASLTSMLACPPIRGTLTSVSEWGTTSFGKRYANFILKDKSGDIDGVIYRANCPGFETKFQVGATLTIENARVKPVKEHYRNKSKSNYELSIADKLKTIEIEFPEFPDDQPVTSNVKSRILIRDLVEKIQPHELVDVIGIIIEVGEIKKKELNGKITIMRDLRIIDESSMSVGVTIWHERAATFNSPVGSVVAIYRVAVRSQGERKVTSLTFNKNSRLQIDPAIEETERLKNWYSEWKSSNEWSLLTCTTSVVVPSRESFIGEKSTRIEATRSDKILAPTDCTSSVVESSLISITDIHQRIQQNENIDTIGLVIAGPTAERVQKKTGSSKMICKIIITDEIRNDIRVDLCGKDSAKIDIPLHSVVVVRKARVHEYKGEKKLRCTGGQINVDPDIPEALRLRNILLRPELVTREEAEKISIREYVREILATGNSDKTHYKSIRMINEQCQPGTKIDIMGIVTVSETELLEKYRHWNSEWLKKVILRDFDRSEIELVVWGLFTAQYDIPLNSIVVAKNATIQIHETKKKLIVAWSDFNLMPEIPEMQKLEELFTNPPVIFAESTVQSPIPVLANNLANSSTIENQVFEKIIKNIPTVEPDVTPLIPRNSVVSVKSNFKKINVINERIAAGATIDVLGIIRRRKNLQVVQCSNGEKVKLMVELADESGQSIRMIIWGPKARDIDDRENLIVAAKKVQVRCWKNEKELNCTDRNSSLIVEPEINEARELRRWFDFNFLDDSIETIVSSVTPIGNLHDGQTSSVLGILLKTNEAKIIGAKYPLDVARTIEIIDNSEKTIRLALWGERARDFNVPEESVILATNVKIFLRNEILGAFMPNSDLKIDPPEFRENIERLIRWFAHYKRNSSGDLDKELEIPMDYSWSEIQNFDQ